ncbi:MAG: ATP-binding protein [Deltaproteobacteria bacterium]|nr:ATP-binding protein [Deltaproteobacteria bacterium]
MRELLIAVQELSLARSVERIAEIVRHAARRLGGADGATFVLRDGEQCHYLDEDAIAPLWKGRRFPLEACVSGWVMRHASAVVIEDIYADPRVPADAYRPTFVQSLAMVPIRQMAPIGAIGCYWARRHAPTDDELWKLQALADSTSVAMENVAILRGLEATVQERTAELALANRELEAFSASVSHDLRTPVSQISMASTALLEDCGAALGELGRDYLQMITDAGTRMDEMIRDLLALARSKQGGLQRTAVDLSELARELCAALREREPGRRVEIAIADDLRADADPALLRLALENLLSNAWKYTRHTPAARIELRRADDGGHAFLLRDNGAGFDMAQAARLFAPFERLHDDSEFEGTGVGLHTVQRIIQRHGGRTWARGEPGRGASFYFTLDAAAEQRADAA